MSANKKAFFSLVLAVLISMVIVTISYRLWEIDINIPPLYMGDGPLGLTISESIYESGFIGNYFVDRIGAPSISTIIDTSFVDMAALIEELILCNFVHSGAALQHVFYYMTFPLCAIAMFILLCRITKNNILRIFFSIVFTVNPYHFSRGFHHASLANYYIVPIAILISLIIYEEEFDKCFPIKYAKKNRILLFLACILLGFSNIYYAFFGILCMSFAVILKAVCSKKIACIWHEGVLVVFTLIGVFVAMLPNNIYHLVYGANECAVLRSPSDTELYGLKIIQMLLPCSYTKVPFFKSIYDAYTNTSFVINENSMSSLGIVASMGFIIACGWIIYLVTKTNKQEVNDSESNVVFKRRVGFFSVTILMLVIYSMTGGVGEIFSYLVVDVIRSVCRSCILIACFSICICVLVYEFILCNLRSKVAKYIAVILGIFVIVFSLYADVFVYEEGYQEVYAEYDGILSEFVENIESQMNDGDMIFSIPYVEFPEGGYQNYMTCYEPAYGYYYSKTLRWSWGAVKGRNDFASYAYVDDGMSKTFVDTIVDAGFKGVYVDTFGYEDMGDAIISFYSDELGLEPIVSDDGRLYFYKLK